MQTETRELTQAEQIFALRMAHHIEQGAGFVEAAAAVMADDQRLIAAFFKRGHNFYVATPDERGASAYTGVHIGDVIAGELSGTVYNRLRAAQVLA